MNELMRGRKKLLKGLGIFLTFMVVCTLVSRGIYASALPQVTVQEPRRMAINHEIIAGGDVKGSRELAVNVQEGLRVEAVLVAPGDKVETGDQLLQLDQEFLEEQIMAAELEKQKLNLQISELSYNLQLEAEQKNREMIRAGEDAVADIQDADRNLSRAQEDEAAARQALAGHEGDRTDLTSDKDRKKMISSYEEWQQALKNASWEVSQAQKRVNELRAEAADLKNKIAALEAEEETGGSPPTNENAPEPAVPDEEQSEEPQPEEPQSEELQSEEPQSGEPQPEEPQSGESQSEEPQSGEPQPEAESQPSEEGEGMHSSDAAGAYFAEERVVAVSDLDALKQQLAEKENELKAAEERLRNAQERYSWLELNPVKNPEGDFKQEDAEQEAWLAKEKQLQDNVKSAERGKEDALHAREDVVVASGRNLEDSLSKENVSSTLKIYELERQQKEREIKKLKELQEAEGKVVAKLPGVITQINVSAGNFSSQGAAITFADVSEPLQFEALLNKEQKEFVNQGDKAVVQLGGNTAPTIDVTVDYLAESEFSPGNYTVIVRLPKENGTIGQSGLFTLNAQLESSYKTCVPLEAIHEKMNKRYVYLLGEKNTILGKELYVQEVPVRILDQNESYAAIESSMISEDAQIIFSTSKALEDGTIVRMKE